MAKNPFDDFDPGRIVQEAFEDGAAKEIAKAMREEGVADAQNVTLNLHMDSSGIEVDETRIRRLAQQYYDADE